MFQFLSNSKKCTSINRKLLYFRADATFETVKQAFGASNCFMLTINSKSLSDPKLLTDYWAQYITRSTESYVICLMCVNSVDADFIGFIYRYCFYVLE